MIASCRGCILGTLAVLIFLGMRPFSVQPSDATLAMNFNLSLVHVHKAPDEALRGFIGLLKAL